MSAAKKPNTASQHTPEISSSVVLLMDRSIAGLSLSRPPGERDQRASVPAPKGILLAPFQQQRDQYRRDDRGHEHKQNERIPGHDRSPIGGRHWNGAALAAIPAKRKPRHRS